ncbi:MULTISPECIES: DegT/DnrJ/EryC1/StrS family aminotransferase [Nocardiopsis]|uniref:DegT/DnrJ/EryC1/StrS family aminotransferase n=2 Tax=Nocardiopsis alba TaxID=53437 RepID=A0A7K2IR94_9ACTN|nr:MULTISPECIES: DegT/DnrJ/EryC1/StrS family aminotransferase [Nocardiopsis]AFR09315.1 degT/DnrJ/EryC1/StrS aminotransferase family protein [Nocardiopsis alba ATCC BAA-2165]MEC3892638.1 DegT/DnrJ/EryC1/StrS family aminotransferase [Nocardiopsis sp. LDBS1602]MYR32433.1 DegT/DnrJ/EryC1/StrS family aminotransferase [Nocardiopsis alba]
MTTYVWGYLEEYAQEREDLLDAVDTVFKSGQLVWGPFAEAFERDFADYHGVAHCAGVDNGTNAIVLALRALGVSPGDEVITVSNTAAPTVLAIDMVGAVPVFVDIDPKTYLMDVDLVEAAITPRTRCILPVHLYGQCVDMDPLQALAAAHDIPVLEDCAQAHGARYKGRIAGSMGQAGAFSFYPTKVLGAYGHAGATITDDPEIDARLRRLRYYGMDEQQYYVVEQGGQNSRLDQVHAEILRRKLTRLDGYIEARRAIAARYDESLKDLLDSGLILPETVGYNEHSYYLYVVRHPERDRIIEAMKAYDISLNISYPWPVHTMTGFSRFGYGKGDLPHTEEVAGEIFSLPMFPSLGESKQAEIIEALRTTVESL